MRWLSGGIVFVAVSTVAACLLGLAGHGLTETIAWFAFVLAALAAVLASMGTAASARRRRRVMAPPAPQKLSKRAQRRMKTAPVASQDDSGPDYRQIWVWIMIACFSVFALRAFCWLFYVDGPKFKIQSPNNLGDLSLHLTYIKTFAAGVPLWPENPIHPFSNLRYPAGTDIFNALLLLANVDLVRGLVWAGLLGSAATCYALYKWSGSFGIAGFLFNGGIAGFEFFRTWKFLDYQGDKTIGWKSIPLSMFVTQRGLLYAIPAGLLLLCHWRTRIAAESSSPVNDEDVRSLDPVSRPVVPPKPVIPFWVELVVYASMPLFHVHTFLALSVLLGWWTLTGSAATRRRAVVLLGSAVVPASFFMWLITDHFHARSILEFKPGWVQRSGDFAAPFFQFWFYNFGLTLPLILALVALLVYRFSKNPSVVAFRSSTALTFVLPAALLFFLACLVKTAPWEWDNIKLIVWSYFIVLPVLWSELISKWPLPVRAGVCVALFGSGFITMIGGMATGKPGYDLADRAEVNGVAAAVRKLPTTARYAAYPTYNHPVLLNGRKVVLGYPGHLWTQGFDYSETEKKLTSLMQGSANWQQTAHDLRVRYLFWGNPEKTNYKTSKRPWERSSLRVASGKWGAIYDLETPAAPSAIR